MLTREVNKSPEHVMINCSFHLNYSLKMIEKRLIDGYRCSFEDSRKAPECNFVSIPIVHDAKYEADSFSIMYAPKEKETFGQRIQLLGFSTHSIKEGYFAVSVFTFAYMEDDDLEFIKKKAEFFFKEKEDVSTTKNQTCAQILPKNTLTLYNYGMSKLATIKTIRDYFDTTLLSARDSINLISTSGHVCFNLAKVSAVRRPELLSDLRRNGVKFKIQ